MYTKHANEHSNEHSLIVGVSFGLTSAIITTLGLMIGLHSFSGSKLVILGAIFTIAIADALSDALGIHLSEESENVHTDKEIWTSTFATFFTKFFFPLTFAIPLILLDVQSAIYVNIIWGLLSLVVLSYLMARSQGKNPIKIALEHLTIAILVIIITHLFTDMVSGFFGNS
ncbi:MAG: hypothetical protein QW802_04100 [Candidatus Altiarchaeota archaeon]